MSHFSQIKTQLKCKESLVSALNTLGHDVEHDVELEVRGGHAEGHPKFNACVAIASDIGFSWCDRNEHYRLIAEEDTWDFEGGWETDFDDDDYNFSVGVLSGAADDVLPTIFEGRVHRDEGRPVTLGELLMGLQEAGRLAEEQRTRERIAKERRDALSTARERFKGSLHVEDLEGDLERTWYALRNRADSHKKSVGLQDVSEELMSMALESGVEQGEAKAEAQVTALVSALFLTNRGYTELSQEPGRNGKVTLVPLWDGEESFSELTAKLHPGEVKGVRSYE